MLATRVHLHVMLHQGTNVAAQEGVERVTKGVRDDFQPLGGWFLPGPSRLLSQPQSGLVQSGPATPIPCDPTFPGARRGLHPQPLQHVPLTMFEGINTTTTFGRIVTG